MSSPGYVLRVHLLEAKNLIPADSNGLSDPYVKFSLGDKSAKSKIIYKTLDPRWNETFQFPVKSPDTDVLSLQLFDHDTFVDDKLGRTKVPLNTLRQGVDEDIWLTLEGVPHGQVHLVLTALNFGKLPSMPINQTPTPAPTPTPTPTPTPSPASYQYHSMPPPKSTAMAESDGQYQAMPPPKNPGKLPAGLVNQHQQHQQPAPQSGSSRSPVQMPNQGGLVTPQPAIGVVQYVQMVPATAAPAPVNPNLQHFVAQQQPQRLPTPPQQPVSPHSQQQQHAIISNVPVYQVYDFGRELGKGSFAVVREATHRTSGQKVAVKIISKEKLMGDNVKLLRREITNLMALDHPNILKLYAIYEDTSTFYLVLELINGKELFDKIVAMGAYTERDVSHIMGQLLSAIAYLHEKGIAHRDLKPENLMSVGTGDSEVMKVADFGLSKNFGEEQLKTSCGSPLYIAPEILTAEHYDKQVDMWALGVILYILLVGYPPFDASNPPLLYRQIMEGRWTMTTEGWDAISNDVKDLVRGLMHQDPRQRLTAQQALQHPWIKRQLDLGQRRLQTERLRSYTRKTLLQP